MELKAIFFSGMLGLLVLTDCNEEEEPAEYGLGKETQALNALVVDTRNGWLLLNEAYGFLELVDPMPDSLKVDGMKLQIEARTGDTYYDRTEDQDMTYARLVSTSPNPDMYTAPPVQVWVIWSPDHSDETNTFPDGYGYQTWVEDAPKILQPDIGIIGGVVPYKTELNAYKVGCYVAHLLYTTKGLPTLDVGDLQFLKIEW